MYIYICTAVGSLNLNDHLSVTGGMTVGTDFSMMPTLICTDTYILIYSHIYSHMFIHTHTHNS